MSNIENPFGGISVVNPFSALGQGPPVQGSTSYGVIPAGFPLVDDLFGALLEFQWRGIGFPVSEFDEELVQGQVLHKFADRDSAHIEPTGRLPLRIRARVPLINYIKKATSESWPERQLYPGVWRQLAAACADRTSGTLQHPERGSLTCKCVRMHTPWRAEVRGGVFVDIEWIESDDTGTDVAESLAIASTAAAVFANAAALDAALASVSPIVVPAPYQPSISFTDLANAVMGVFDQATLLQKEFAGRIDNLVYEANALEYSIGQFRNALNWPFYQAAEALKDSCYVLKTELLNTSSSTIGIYNVQKDSTLGQLAAAIPAPIDDLMQLNPTLVSLGIVPSGLQVRYYQSVAA